MFPVTVPWNPSPRRATSAAKRAISLASAPTLLIAVPVLAPAGGVPVPRTRSVVPAVARSVTSAARSAISPVPALRPVELPMAGTVRSAVEPSVLAARLASPAVVSDISPAIASRAPSAITATRLVTSRGTAPSPRSVLAIRAVLRDTFPVIAPTARPLPHNRSNV
ncbi:hypothetical protein DACRYDRAFT_118615 [Dacryopinax primogenitus]|uniref:Uncharacterized protein n=1 Tax=Dacryopinax primogenitus (strain DJM 731) TaxID=1858805 RepID=M5FP79_DACPD|nr:uncharacterized protein DACRYDRAFT_118615 [Dacryopinax primogenitus]EJT98305.1 hypothetical protein DACRYDRAFT_118615 [Dacryopinax primogenitus]